MKYIVFSENTLKENLRRFSICLAIGNSTYGFPNKNTKTYTEPLIHENGTNVALTIYERDNSLALYEKYYKLFGVEPEVVSSLDGAWSLQTESH